MKFFKIGESEAESRQKFLDLSKKYHPDAKGNAEIFKEIRAEYDEIKIIQKFWPELTQYFKSLFQFTEKIQTNGLADLKNVLATGADLMKNLNSSLKTAKQIINRK